MRSLSIQSLMISVTAAFSGLLALRWSDYIIHFYSWVQTMHRSSFQDDSQTTYVTHSYFLTYLVFRLWPILVFFTSSVIVLREQNMAFNILTNTHGMLLYLITCTKKIKSFVSLYATSSHWSWHCDSYNFLTIINYGKMHQIQYNLTIIINLDKFNKPA